MKISPLKTAVFLFIICTVITFIFAANGYPLFVVDSGCFLPPSYFINHYHALINPFYDAGVDTVHHKYLFYPPLFPYIVSVMTELLPAKTATIQIALTIIDNLSIALLLLSIYKYARQKGNTTGFTENVFAAVLIVAVFAFHGISSGRPEILSKLLITVFILNNLLNTKYAKHIINGLLLGLALINSPVSASYLIVITGALLTYHNSINLKTITCTFLGFCFILGIFCIVYPFKLTELIAGIRTHSANAVFNQVGQDNLQTFISRHLTVNDHPLSIVPVLIAVTYLFVYLMRRKFYFTTLLLIILVVMIGYFACRNFMMSYNLYVLSPFVFFIVGAAFIRYCKNRTFASRLIVWVIILVFAINSTGFLRKTAVFFKVKDKLVTSAAFRSTLLKIMGKTNETERVVISHGLWPYALDLHKKIILYRTGDMDYLFKDPTVKYMLIQQSNSGLFTPLQYPGFKLIKTEFVNNRIVLGSIVLGNTYPGHQVAIYERQ